MSNIKNMGIRSDYLNVSNIKRLEEEKQLMASLIESHLQTSNLVEFNNQVKFTYVDGKRILTPTIARCYAKNDKTATLVTPNIHTGFTSGNLSVVKTSLNNPFGEYQELINSDMLKKLKEAECFLASDYIPGLEKRFKAWAGMGIPCVYLVYSDVNETTDFKKAEKFMKNLTDGNALTIENVSYNDERYGSACEAYILKR